MDLNVMMLYPLFKALGINGDEIVGIVKKCAEKVRGFDERLSNIEKRLAAMENAVNVMAVAQNQGLNVMLMREMEDANVRSDDQHGTLILPNGRRN